MNKLFGLLGHRIGHSMSPLMQNDAFYQLGYPGHYHAFDVSSDQLKDTVAAIRVLNISGFNVTIPHKVAIIEFLDEIDEEARIIGAVNTVANIDGRLIGYNTDGRGYLSSLLKVIEKPLAQSQVLVIGAGGAARAVVTAIMNSGVSRMTIANRTIEKAASIKENYQQYKRGNINILTLKEAEAIIGTYDIIINTTSVGMSPNTDEIPIDLENIKTRVILSDLIYNPIWTKWLRLGEEKGAIIHNGVGMFVEQGALAFQKWTGQVPDTEKMTRIVMKKLGGI
ncbi:shikimate dehydrogenase [Bacillaceae bacterium IKA-2]|nr:shikimate dehydrogenase [Bacillaceae bacterium IKA-2]